MFNHDGSQSSVSQDSDSAVSLVREGTESAPDQGGDAGLRDGRVLGEQGLEPEVPSQSLWRLTEDLSK